MISITTQLWVLCRPRLSPIALFLGYIQTWQGLCHTVQQTSMQAGMGEQETEPSAVMGLLHSKNIRAQTESLFPKAGIVHLTVNATLPSCSHQNKHKKAKLCTYLVVLRLPLPMEGLAMYFPSDES